MELYCRNCWCQFCRHPPPTIDSRKRPCCVGNLLSIELAQPPFRCYSRGCDELLSSVVHCRANAHAVLAASCPLNSLRHWKYIPKGGGGEGKLESKNAANQFWHHGKTHMYFGNIVAPYCRGPARHPYKASYLWRPILQQALVTKPPTNCGTASSTSVPRGRPGGGASIANQF